MAEGKSSVLVPVLAIAVAGLGFVNYSVFNLNVDTTPVAPTAASAADKGQSAKELASALTPALRGVQEFPLTAAHPIFFPNRRPPEKLKPKEVAAVEIKAPVVPAAPLEPLQLVGIIGAGAGRQALVRTSADPQGTWLSVGDEFRGWQLREVTADNIVVEARGQRSELRLYAPSSGKPAKP